MNSYIPSTEEMMGWDPQTLAEYMTELKLSGCDMAVMKRGISGAEFMQMTEQDLQVFPSLYFPTLCKIQSKVFMSAKKQSYQQRSNVQKSPQQAYAQGGEEEVWDSDEFDKSDYEDGTQQGGDDCTWTMSEPEDEKYISDGYPIPPNEEIMNLPPPLSYDTLEDSDYREDTAHDLFPDQWNLQSIPPPPHPSYPAQTPPKSPAGPPPLSVDRNKKPGKSASSKKEHQKSKGGTIKELKLFTRKGSKSSPSKPTDMAARRSSHCPPPPVPKLPADINSPGHSSDSRECIVDLDPSWYGGQVTRHQAEAAVREVNEDGAFIVRDSSKGSDMHPYTLVLLAHNKVYNIRICNQGNTFFLGNSLNKKSFPGVKEIITHHTHTPLLLIDAKDPNSEAQSKCCLLHPAGL